MNLSAPAVAFATRLVSGASVRWRGAGPSTAAKVYFANHTSHLDGAVIWAVLPGDMRRRTRPVAARDYWEANPLRRWLAARVFNALLVDRLHPRKALTDLDRMTRVLERGDSLIIFPEGSRGDGLRIGEFKGGLHRLAAENPTVEFIPVYLENLNRILPKGEVFPVPLISHLTFGLPLARVADEGKDAFLERARQAVMDLRDT